MFAMLKFDENLYFEPHYHMKTFFGFTMMTFACHFSKWNAEKSHHTSSFSPFPLVVSSGDEGASKKASTTNTH